MEEKEKEKENEEKELNGKNENNLEKKFIVSTSPHLLRMETTSSIMWIVILSLLPATIFGIFAFGWYSALIIGSSIFTCILTEGIILKIRKKRISIDDGSAFLTGLLVALSMPPTVPLYIPIISSIFAIGIVKQAFGGLGENWANPAIAARIFALFAWTKHMTTWISPFMTGESFDSITTATPLGALKSAMLEGSGSSDSVSSGVSTAWDFISGIFNGPLEVVSKHLGTDLDYFKLFFGFKGGCIGEISIFLLLIGAIFLIIRKIITLDIPLSYIGTVIIISFVFGGLQFNKGFFQGDFLFQILTGGLVFGAFFCATDLVTTPLTIKGRILFGIGCGIITMLIRLLGGLPEGVSLSILFMNMLTPAIDRFIKIKPLGYIKQKE